MRRQPAIHASFCIEETPLTSARTFLVASLPHNADNSGRTRISQRMTFPCALCLFSRRPYAVPPSPATFRCPLGLPQVTRGVSATHSKQSQSPSEGEPKRQSSPTLRRNRQGAGPARHVPVLSAARLTSLRSLPLS